MYKRTFLGLTATIVGLAFWALVQPSQVPQLRTVKPANLKYDKSAKKVISVQVTPSKNTISTAEDFQKWLSKWQNSNQPIEQKSLLESGIQLAKKRAATMKRLIREHPDTALELALSYADYAALPKAIQAIVEEPFSDSGSVDVTTLCNEHTTHYLLEYTNGEAYAVFMPSEHRIASSKKSLPIQGIRLDGLAVLRSSIFQIVTESDANFVNQNWPTGQSNSQNDYATGQPIKGEGITAIAGGHVFHFQNNATLKSVENALKEADDMPGHDLGSHWILREVNGDGFPFAQFSSEIVAANYASTTGAKTAIVIMVNFQDLTVPANQVTLEQAIDLTVSDALAAYSYGTTSMNATIYDTVVTIDNNAADYLNDPQDGDPATKDYNDIYNEAVAEYLAIEGSGTPNPNSVYDTVCVYFGNAGFSWAGLASVGGQRMWLKNTTKTEVILHEFGHNYGLKHANYWEYDHTDSASTNPVDPTGASNEYGDDFDVMGDGSVDEGHFHMGAKQDLGWIQTSDWEDLVDSNDNDTYRVYRFDHIDATGNQALRIAKSATNDHYWIGYRKDYESLQSFAKGAYLTWERTEGSTNRNQSWLVDTTPQSADGKDDAPIGVGRTYSDPVSQVHITPIALGGSSPNEYIDVVVNFGSFPNNDAPAGSISGPTTTNARQVELFSASATDTDGDTLAYSWDMGDGIIQTNSSSITHSWASGGTYNIAVTISDMKGGSVTLNQTVIVTDPLTNWVSRNSTTTEDLKAIASNDTYVIAVGDDAGMLRSTDGVTWTDVSPSSGVLNLNCEDIIWDGTEFLIAGFNYDFDIPGWEGVVYTSTNGTTWTLVHETNVANTEFDGIASDGNGTVVAVGKSGAVARRSGGSWANIDAGVPNTKRLRDVTYGDGYFVAVGSNNSSNGSVEIRRSTNGLNWTDESSGINLANWKDLRSIQFTGQHFVASGFYAQVLHSTDQGQTWSTNLSGNILQTEDFASGAGILYTVGRDRDNSNAEVDLISDDGLNWTTISPGSLDDRYGITFFNNTFITVGADGSIRQSDTTTASTSFETFTDTYFPSGSSDADTTANSDFDWANNLIEYALGGDPIDNESSPSQPVFSLDPSGYPVFKVTRAVKQSDVAYSIWWSTNLIDWTQSGLTIEEDSSTTLRVRGTAPQSDEENAFFRLILSQ